MRVSWSVDVVSNISISSVFVLILVLLVEISFELILIFAEYTETIQKQLKEENKPKRGRPKKAIMSLDLETSGVAKTRHRIPSFVTSEAELSAFTGGIEKREKQEQEEIIKRQSIKLAKSLKSLTSGAVASKVMREKLQESARTHQLKLDVYTREEQRKRQDIKTEYKFRKQEVERLFRDYDVSSIINSAKKTGRRRETMSLLEE